MGPYAEEPVGVTGEKVDRQGLAKETENYGAHRQVVPGAGRGGPLRSHAAREPGPTEADAPRADPTPATSAGASMEGSPTIEDRRLRDIQEGSDPIRCTARVLSAELREVPKKDGSGRVKVLSGLLSDGSATMRFSWWDPPNAAEIERGTVLRVTNPRVRSWNDRRELSFGWKTQVELASEMELPRLEDHEFITRTVAELRPGDEGLHLLVRVLFSEPRRLRVGERERAIRSGLLADTSGRVPFTAWTDLDLPSGAVVELFGAYVRSYQGELQVSLDERTRVERREGSALGQVTGPEGDRPAEIGLLEERAHGGRQVIEGVVVEVRSPSGLVYRCPECSRSLAKGICREHGTVRGEPDLRARLVLDDGTGTLTAQVPRPMVEELLGMDLGKAIEMAREKLDAGAVQELLVERVVGRRVRLMGRSVPGEWGLTFFVDRTLPVPAWAEREAQRLLDHPEAALREDAA